jgi:hypothetical protein
MARGMPNGGRAGPAGATQLQQPQQQSGAGEPGGVPVLLRPRSATIARLGARRRARRSRPTDAAWDSFTPGDQLLKRGDATVEGGKLGAIIRSVEEEEPEVIAERAARYVRQQPTKAVAHRAWHAIHRKMLYTKVLDRMKRHPTALQALDAVCSLTDADSAEARELLGYYMWNTDAAVAGWLTGRYKKMLRFRLASKKASSKRKLRVAGTAATLLGEVPIGHANSGRHRGWRLNPTPAKVVDKEFSFSWPLWASGGPASDPAVTARGGNTHAAVPAAPGVHMESSRPTKPLQLDLQPPAPPLRLERTQAGRAQRYITWGGGTPRSPRLGVGHSTPRGSRQRHRSLGVAAFSPTSPSAVPAGMLTAQARHERDQARSEHWFVPSVEVCERLLRKHAQPSAASSSASSSSAGPTPPSPRGTAVARAAGAGARASRPDSAPTRRVNVQAAAVRHHRPVSATSARPAAMAAPTAAVPQPPPGPKPSRRGPLSSADSDVDDAKAEVLIGSTELRHVVQVGDRAFAWYQQQPPCVLRMSAVPGAGAMASQHSPSWCTGMCPHGRQHSRRRLGVDSLAAADPALHRLFREELVALPGDTQQVAAAITRKNCEGHALLAHAL